MNVIHPQEPFMGYPTEDVFVAVNDLGVQQGYGYVVPQYQPAVYPDHPMHIFFDMDCSAEAEYCIFGALVARARALRNLHPEAPARLYTSAALTDSRKLDFLMHNGLTNDNSEDMVRLQIPADPGAEMFNCNITPLTSTDVQQLVNLADRLARNGLPHITLQHLRNLQSSPVFHVWGLTYGNQLVSECIIAGRSDAAELVGIYTVESQQRQGRAKYLLRRALNIVGQEGVTEVRTRIMSASQTQVRLVRSFGAELLEKLMYFPSLEL